MRKILAISSGGGHWVQMLRLRPAFDGCAVTYACVRPAYAEDVPGETFVAYTDATRWDRWRLLKMLLQVAWLVLRLRPDVVSSTGGPPVMWRSAWAV
jgi:UDP-N-acetylglucosamine:LPS N-acetylglucosamine transferase